MATVQLKLSSLSCTPIPNTDWYETHVIYSAGAGSKFPAYHIYIESPEIVISADRTLSFQTKSPERPVRPVRRPYQRR